MTLTCRLADSPNDSDFGPGLLQDLAHLLRNLQTWRVSGPLARALPCRPYLEGRPFPRLNHLELFLAPEVDDCASENDETMITNLALIPSLRESSQRQASRTFLRAS